MLDASKRRKINVCAPHVEAKNLIKWLNTVHKKYI
jgi:hypothetical protein